MGRTGRERFSTQMFARAEGVVVRKIAGETILVPTTGELANMQRIFVLDEVGEFVWGSLDGTRDLAAVTRCMTGEFDVKTEQAEADLAEFVEALSDAGLVTTKDGEGEGPADDSTVSTDHR